MTLDEKLSRLREILKQTGGVLVAFSGGVDSTFLTKVAYDVLGAKALAVTVRSAIHPEFEHREARELAHAIGIRHLIIDADVLAVPGLVANPPDRCYICKREIFTALADLARREGLSCVADGSNADDSRDYRPGARATRELGILSPLRDAGLTKAEIRELSCRMGLATWDKPSYACLASRIPYGQEITPDKLAAIEKAEDLLRAKGYRVFRVRHHGDVARIELAPGEIRTFIEKEDLAEIAARMKSFGFAYVALDLEGYRTGSLNETLGDAGTPANEGSEGR